MRITIKSLIIKFFMEHPNKLIKNHIVVERVDEQYYKARGKYPVNVSVNINHLHLEGRLIHVGYRVYKYDPDYDREGKFQDFSEADKQVIFRRDDFKCVVCGCGEQNGVKIAADHKIARFKGGMNTLENGQTLCYEYNSIKKNYSQI